MIKAIIFDVDDTLIDFSKISTSLVQETAKELNIKPPNKKQLDRVWGIPLRKSLKMLNIHVSYINFWKILFKKYLQHRKEFKQIPGTSKTIEKLKNKYILGVLSSKPKPILILQFRDTKIPYKYFKFKFAASDTKYHKPNPKVFSKLIKKIHPIKRKEILYVGDTVYDYIAAKKANLNFVAVQTGHFGNKDFKKQGLKNKNIIKSIAQLPSWLNKNDK